jgi:hypothetical protein
MLRIRTEAERKKQRNRPTRIPCQVAAAISVFKFLPLLFMKKIQVNMGFECSRFQPQQLTFHYRPPLAASPILAIGR